MWLSHCRELGGKKKKRKRGCDGMTSRRKVEDPVPVITFLVSVVRVYSSTLITYLLYRRIA